MTFSLQPFPDADLPEIAIAGKLARHANQLHLRYEVSGDVAQIDFVPPAELPSRRSQLWKATCFEFFLGLPNSSRYWEFNLAPSGDWNVYRLEDYRTGMQEEAAIKLLPFSMESGEIFTLNLHLDLSTIIQPEQVIELSITTVIKTLDGKFSYWALKHCGKQADFHLRNSFEIAI
jgi:hypothetical protein